MALCSSSSNSAGDGNGGDGNGKKKPPAAVAEAEADAEADTEMELYDETEGVQLVDVHETGPDGELPDDATEALQKYDPENISTMPPVVVFPFATRPIFPGIFQPVEVIDPRLVAALTAAKASHHPYVGVFLPREQKPAGEKGGDKDVVPIADPSELHEVGTLAQIMRLSPTPQGAQVLLVGGRRVTIEHVVGSPGSGDGQVLEVKVKEAKDELEAKDADPSVAKAYAMEVMQTIKEILKLNPFFKEQMQMILERTEARTMQCTCSAHAVHMSMHLHSCTRTHAHAHTHTHAHRHTHAHMHTCTHAHVHNTHPHPHTQPSPSPQPSPHPSLQPSSPRRPLLLTPTLTRCTRRVSWPTSERRSPRRTPRRYRRCWARSTSWSASRRPCCCSRRSSSSPSCRPRSARASRTR